MSTLFHILYFSCEQCERVYCVAFYQQLIISATSQLKILDDSDWVEISVMINKHGLVLVRSQPAAGKIDITTNGRTDRWGVLQMQNPFLRLPSSNIFCILYSCITEQ